MQDAQLAVPGDPPPPTPPRECRAGVGIQGLLRQNPSPPFLPPVTLSTRWSPAITSSWYSRWASPMTDWWPACTSWEGEDDIQDSLLPVELAPMFAATAASHAPSPPHVSSSDPTQLCDENADLSEYTVHVEAMPRSPSPMTPGSGPSDPTEFEVPVAEATLCNRGLAPSGLCVEDPPARRVRSCVELPGYARGRIPLPSPSHSAMLYTMMQVDRSPEDQVVHGRASTKQA